MRFGSKISMNHLKTSEYIGTSSVIFRHRSYQKFIPFRQEIESKLWGKSYPFFYVEQLFLSIKYHKVL